MRIFCTGASGYIGGSIAIALAAAGHEVSGLVRSDRNADRVRTLGITPVYGTLDDADVLGAAAARADAVLHAANADHEPSARAMLQTLEGTGKAYIHMSGSSIVGTQSAGERVDATFDENTPYHPIGWASCAGRIERICTILQGKRHSLDHHLSKPRLRNQPWTNEAQHANSMADRTGEESRRRQALWPR